MYNRRVLIGVKGFQCLLLSGLLWPLTLHASFIESTVGAAVVNDATATYYNPAALTLLKNPQIIGLGSAAFLNTHFTGQFTQPITGFTQSGSSSTRSHYYLPSLYVGLPTTSRIMLGFAIISNDINRDADANSILRYTQSSNSIQDIDLVPAVGIKLTDFLSVGAGVNFSYANFLLEPISGFPSLNIPDNLSRNQCSGTGFGGDIGFLLKPSVTTTIGFNYRSSITYELSGKSTLEANPNVISNHYHLTFWTPARSVISINHFVTSTLGFISTVQRIQWSIFDDVHIHGIATQAGPRAIIVNANVPYHLRDTWLLTLGSHYRVTPKWIVRVAGTYNQASGNGSYQITNGDSITLGSSMGYEIVKNIIIDGSYAHTFIKDRSIHIANQRSVVNGVNEGAINAVSLKLTFNL
jgi:long-subunit fatty acid transport protein